MRQCKATVYPLTYWLQCILLHIDDSVSSYILTRVYPLTYWWQCILTYWLQCILLHTDYSVSSYILMTVYPLTSWLECILLHIDDSVSSYILMTVYPLTYWLQCSLLCIDYSVSSYVLTTVYPLMYWLVYPLTYQPQYIPVYSKVFSQGLHYSVSLCTSWVFSKVYSVSLCTAGSTARIIIYPCVQWGVQGLRCTPIRLRTARTTVHPCVQQGLQCVPVYSRVFYYQDRVSILASKPVICSNGRDITWRVWVQVILEQLGLKKNFAEFLHTVPVPPWPFQILSTKTFGPKHLSAFILVPLAVQPLTFLGTFMGMTSHSPFVCSL